MKTLLHCSEINVNYSNTLLIARNFIDKITSREQAVAVARRLSMKICCVTTQMDAFDFEAGRERAFCFSPVNSHGDQRLEGSRLIQCANMIYIVECFCYLNMLFSQSIGTRMRREYYS